MAADLDSGSASDAVLSLAGKMQHAQDTIAHSDGVPHMPGGNSSEKAVAKTGEARPVLEAVVVIEPGKVRENTDAGNPYLSSQDNNGEGGVRSESETIATQPAKSAPLEGALGPNQQVQPSQLNDQESRAYPPVREMESGEGPPYAPPGWRWRVGRRQANGTWTDRYFYPPGGKREFASKKQVEHYLKYTQPGIDLDAFWETYRWRIPAVDGSGEKRRADTGSDASAKPLTSDTTKRAKSSRESSPAAPRAHSASPGPSDPRSCPKQSAACGLVTGKSYLLIASKVAPCDICCAEDGFCRTCSCIFCNGDVRGDGSSTAHVNSIWCARSSGAGLCGHAAHLRCALSNKAAVSNKKERTVNYLCRRCGETNILSLDDGRPVSGGDPPFVPDNQPSQSTSLASGTSKLDPSSNGHRHPPEGLEAHLSTVTKGELDQNAEAGGNGGSGFIPGGQPNGEAKEGGAEDEFECRVKEERHGQSSTAQLDSDRGGSAAQAGTPPLEALNSFTGRSDAGGEDQQEDRSHEGGHSHQEKQPPVKQEPAQSEDPFEVELARALLHLPDGLPDDGAPRLTDSDEFRTEKRRKDLLIAVTDGLRERGESSDSGDEPQASTPGGGLNTLAGRRILAEEKGAYGLRKSASQQSFDSGYSTPPDEVIDGVSRPKRSRGRARTPRMSAKSSQWGRAAQDVTNGAHSDDQMAAEVLGGGFEAEKQWNIPPKKRGGPGRPKRKMEPAGPAASREPSAGLSEDAAPASDDELNPRNPPKSRFVTDGFHRTAARVKKEGFFEVAGKRDEEEENPGPIPIGSKVPRASRSARHTRVHISASFLLASGEHDSPAQSDSQPHDSEIPGSPGGRSESPSVSGLKRKLEARENGPAPKRKGRPPGSRKDGGNGRGVVVDFEADLDGAMNGGFGAAKAWLHQQAGLTLLESQQLTSQEERVDSACRALKQQIDTFSPTGKTLFSRLDDLIDKLKAAKDIARHEIGEYHKMVVQLLDNRGVHVQMY